MCAGVNVADDAPPGDVEAGGEVTATAEVADDAAAVVVVVAVVVSAAV